MSDASDPADGGDCPPTEPGVRGVVAVAVLFALLGGLLVRLATADPGALVGAFAVVALAAATVVFGARAVRTAVETLRP